MCTTQHNLSELSVKDVDEDDIGNIYQISAISAVYIRYWQYQQYISDIGRTGCSESTPKLRSSGPGLTPRSRRMEEQASATKF